MNYFLENVKHDIDGFINTRQNDVLDGFNEGRLTKIDLSRAMAWHEKFRDFLKKKAEEVDSQAFYDDDYDDDDDES